jgi:peptide/nickel transport system substrate-binding protein
MNFKKLNIFLLAKSNQSNNLSLAKMLNLPGLNFVLKPIAHGVILFGMIGLLSCNSHVSNSIRLNNATVDAATISPTIEIENKNHSTGLATIEFDQIDEPTLITETPNPFIPLKVNADDCEYGGKIKSIQAIDQYSVRFEFCSPEVAFLSKIAFPAFSIQSADWLEKVQQKGDYEELLEKPIGTGPYQLEEWQKGSYISLVAFEDYWSEGEPHARELIINWERDPSQRLLAMQSGVVDGIDNPNFADFHLITDDSNLELFIRPAMNVSYIGINNQVSPFDDQKVRQAIAMGLDRQKMIEKTFPEGYEVASYFAPCSIPMACGGEDWYAFDPDQGRQLLEEAGYPNGFQTEIFYRDVLRGYLPQPDIVAEEIQEQLWENLRINARIRKLDPISFIEKVDSGLLEGLYLLGWGADYPEISNFLNPHFGEEVTQLFGHKNIELTRLLSQAMQVSSNDTRHELYGIANDIIRKIVPMIPISHGGWSSSDSLAVAYDQGVENGAVNPFGFEIFSKTGISGQEVFHWMQTEEPLSLYCPNETDIDSLRVCFQIYETLYSFANNSVNPVPKLAEICKPEENYLVWICELREDVLFHDDTSLDANDVVLSFLLQWDYAHPLHARESTSHEYFGKFWLGFINAE